METKTTIEIQGHTFEVATGPLTGNEIKSLGGHHEGSVYRLIGEDQQRIADHETTKICGGERFLVQRDHDEHRGHHSIRIEVDGKPFDADHAEMTGAEIKALAKKPAANTLYRIEARNGRPFRREIGDTETIHLHAGECLITQPPVGKAS